MINKIGVDTTSRINGIEARKNKKEVQTPNFKGGGNLLLQGIQYCEKVPMVNVAVVDMLSAILPRTIVESMTNWFAGFEAFRRESSGLVVNCLIPSLITLGFAKMLNGSTMGGLGKKIDMSECWADSSLINEAKEYYNKSASSDKVKDALRNILGDIEGFEGKEKIVFKEDALSAEELDKYADRLAELSRSNKSNKDLGKEVKKISAEIVDKTRVAENVKIAGIKNEVKASSVNGMLVDSVKFFKGFQSRSQGTIEDFARKSKNLVRAKSGLGLAVILPLAISMQYINRWITGKVSGVKGAPIYDDFAKGKDNIEQDPAAKEGLLKQKIISISSMIGVSLLSMMKKPTLGMLEFKGMFPTMDQARVISTATFASRMAAADDKNELAESTVRDIATFSGLYFLGDYADKGAATLIEKTKGVRLLNDTKPLKADANVFEKFWHWVKDVKVKSSDEVVSKTAELLKKQGKTPDAEQLKIIEKELKHAVNLRSACQATNIGVSLALLGILVPIYTRHNTKKKHERALKLAQENAQTQTENKEQTETLTPLNVKYSKLTAGFRADKR